MGAAAQLPAAPAAQVQGDNAEQALKKLAQNLGLILSLKERHYPGSPTSSIEIILANQENNSAAYLYGECKRNDEGDLDALNVVPTLRRRGLGRSLFNLFKEKCHTAGCKIIRWSAESSSEDAPPHDQLLQFYKSVGGQEEEQTPFGATRMFYRL
jgi:GNAT superfamily N-acetyltransferase